MEIQEINNLTNDILVARLEAQSYQAEYDELLKSPELVELQQKIAAANEIKRQKQEELIEIMRSHNLKSWKTEQANYARVIKQTATINPAVKKAIENAMKDGEEVEGWELKTTEYISIKEA